MITSEHYQARRKLNHCNSEQFERELTHSKFELHPLLGSFVAKEGNECGLVAKDCGKLVVSTMMHLTGQNWFTRSLSGGYKNDEWQSCTQVIL